MSRPQKKVHSLHDPATAKERSLALLKPKDKATPANRREPVSLSVSGVIKFRAYQKPVFRDRSSGLLVLHWSRQIGKSFTLAAWAVDRLITRPGRLVTVLSNSRDNGAEFLNKCVEICDLNDTVCERVDESTALNFEAMRMELRIVAYGLTGRIKVLAANPRTARGFSGDLILDEFAFHEDSQAIWEAAEPILSSNQDFLCRVASTGNGRHNFFYRLAAPTALETSGAGKTLSRSAAGYLLSRVTRSQAHALGVQIYDPQTRLSVAPAVARDQALDKRAYDQNYECSFADENLTLLSHELINKAEQPGVGLICEQDWSNVVVGLEPAAAASGNGRPTTLDFLRGSLGPLYAGFDVGRKVDLSVITVVEKLGDLFYLRALLRLRDLRLPEQQLRLGEICRLPNFKRVAIDMTGLGLGLFEYAQQSFGAGRVSGVNFATTVPATRAILGEGRKRETVRVTEAMALELLQAYEDGRIRQPADLRLRDDLRKPERVTSPGGRVSIAATRDEAGHADHFWSLALALEAAGNSGAACAGESLNLRGGRKCLL